jgi:hypothetical protein
VHLDHLHQSLFNTGPVYGVKCDTAAPGIKAQPKKPDSMGVRDENAEEHGQQPCSVWSSQAWKPAVQTAQGLVMNCDAHHNEQQGGRSDGNPGNFPGVLSRGLTIIVLDYGIPESLLR